MQIKEMRAVPATMREVVARLKCDLCGRESDEYNGWGKSDEHIEETEVRYKSGRSECWGGGCATEFEADICPACFKNKLIPWLQDQGATIRESESDW